MGLDDIDIGDAEPGALLLAIGRPTGKAVSVSIGKGDILGLIGPNGAGKSTFFNCLTGDLMPTSGRVILNGEDVSLMTPEQRAHRGLARSFQVPQTFETMSVLENVMIGAFLRTSDPSKARRRAYEVLDLVGLVDVASAVAGSLGTPGRKRLEIARALATDPEILLLDEAMAGLTATEVQVERLHARVAADDGGVELEGEGVERPALGGDVGQLGPVSGVQVVRAAGKGTRLRTGRRRGVG